MKMKSVYYRPQMNVVLLQERIHLLQASRHGMDATMSGYNRGGSSPTDSDGWGD